MSLQAVGLKTGSARQPHQGAAAASDIEQAAAWPQKRPQPLPLEKGQSRNQSFQNSGEFSTPFAVIALIVKPVQLLAIRQWMDKDESAPRTPEQVVRLGSKRRVERTAGGADRASPRPPITNSLIR